MRTIGALALAALLSGCSFFTSQTAGPTLSPSDVQKVQIAYSGLKTSAALYLIATHASADTVRAVTKAESIADPEVAQVGSLQAPVNLTALQGDINGIVAALPSGTLSGQAPEYVMLEQSIQSMAQALATAVAAAPPKPAAAG